MSSIRMETSREAIQDSHSSEESESGLETSREPVEDSQYSENAQRVAESLLSLFEPLRRVIGAASELAELERAFRTLLNEFPSELALESTFSFSFGLHHFCLK